MQIARMIMIITFNALAYNAFDAFGLDCKFTKSTCVEGKEEREVDGFLVTKDCWKYEDSFECEAKSDNNCEAIREAGCVRDSEECIRDYKGTCVEYLKKYNCYKDVATEGSEERIKLNAKSTSARAACQGIRCLDGGCLSDTNEANDPNDMLNAAVQMKALEDMGKNAERNSADEIVSVFRGDELTCKLNDNFWELKNCCGSSPDGWGVNVGFMSCPSDARAVMARIKAGQCVELGTYCSKWFKVFGVKATCWEQSKAYCCFSGRLQKVIQEQGRKQLGIGFGSAEHPDCRGLTTTEIASLKFDQMNFSEAYADLEYKLPDATKAASRISDGFASIKKDFEKNTDQRNAGINKNLGNG